MSPCDSQKEDALGASRCLTRFQCERSVKVVVASYTGFWKPPLGQSLRLTSYSVGYYTTFPYTALAIEIANTYMNYINFSR